MTAGVASLNASITGMGAGLSTGAGGAAESVATGNQGPTAFDASLAAVLEGPGAGPGSAEPRPEEGTQTTAPHTPTVANDLTVATWPMDVDGPRVAEQRPAEEELIGEDETRSEDDDDLETAAFPPLYIAPQPVTALPIPHLDVTEMAGGAARAQPASPDAPTVDRAPSRAVATANPGDSPAEPTAEEVGGAPSADGRAPRTEARAPGGEIREPSAEGQATDGEIRKPTAAGPTPRAERRGPSAGGRSPSGESEAASAEVRGPSAEVRAPSAERRAPVADGGASSTEARGARGPKGAPKADAPKADRGRRGAPAEPREAFVEPNGARDLFVAPLEAQARSGEAPGDARAAASAPGEMGPGPRGAEEGRVADGVRAAEAVTHRRTLANGEASGQLVTPELGRIEVRARAEEARIDVHVRADEAHARDLLSVHAPELVAHVRAEVPEARVHVPDASANHHPQAQQQPMDGRDPRDPRAGFGGDGPSADGRRDGTSTRGRHGTVDGATRASDPSANDRSRGRVRIVL